MYFEENLKPLLHLFRFFGCYPLRINHKNGNRSSSVSVIWCLLVVIYFLFQSLYSLTARDVYFKSFLSTITDSMQNYVSLTNAVVSIVFLVFMRKKLAFYLEKLSQFDNSFFINFENMMSNKTTIQSKIWTTITSLLICIYCWLDYMLYTKELTFAKVGDVVAYCYPIVLALLVVTQFCLVTLLLKERFGWINKKLVQIQHRFNNNSSTASDTPQTDKIIKSLEYLRHKHDTLCSLSETVNEIYSVPLLLTTLQNFTIIIVTCFLYVEDSKPLKEGHSPLLYNISIGCILVIICAEMITMAKICSKTTDEAKLTALILGRFQHKSLDVDNFVEFFSMQLMHSDVKFTACAIFTIDETLLYSMVGAVTTYLVIVLQLQLNN